MLKRGVGRPRDCDCLHLGCSLPSRLSIHSRDQLWNVPLRDRHIPRAAIGGSRQ